MVEEQRAGLGQRDANRTALAGDKTYPDRPLESSDLLADRGLHVAQPVGRAAERALAGNGVERCQVPQLDAHPSVACVHEGASRVVYPYVERPRATTYSHADSRFTDHDAELALRRGRGKVKGMTNDSSSRA